MAKKTLLSWSSGKDSAWALNLLRKNPEVEVTGLVTTVNSSFDRVAMHAVRRALLAEQASRAGLPLWVVEIPEKCTNAEYEERMRGLIDRARQERVEAMAFGDLFLEDVREYRVKMLKGTGIEPAFPLWGLDTAELSKEMISAGVKAIVTCVDPKVLDPGLAGKAWDNGFIRELPQGADPCGENGEFHTFVHSGPMFDADVRVRPGGTTERDGFVFADLVPAGEASAV